MNEHKRQLANEDAAQQVIEVRAGLIGLAVYWQDDEEQIGRVTDALIVPETGWLSALLFRGHSGQGYLARPGAFSLREHAVYAAPDAVEPEPFGALPGVLAERELTGALVLTNEGYLLGRICRVYLRTSDLAALYCVARTWWERWQRRGFFLAGQAAKAYSYPTAQLIVPFNTMERLAQPTLVSLLAANERDEARYARFPVAVEAWEERRAAYRRRHHQRDD